MEILTAGASPARGGVAAGSARSSGPSPGDGRRACPESPLTGPSSAIAATVTAHRSTPADPGTAAPAPVEHRSPRSAEPRGSDRPVNTDRIVARGRPGPHRPGVRPGHRGGTGEVVLASDARRRPGRAPVAGRLGRVAGHLAHRPDPDPVRLPRAGRPPPGRPGPADHRRARQGHRGRPRRGGPGHRGHRVRLRHSPPVEGGVLRGRLQRRRRLVHPPAPRRGGRDHPVQLPGHGAHVDVPGGHRLRQHLHPQAVRARPFAVAAHRRPVAGGRPARRRVHRGPRRLGGRRRPARPPRCGRRVLRGVDAGGPPRLRAGHRDRQALPGARRRQEPRRGPPRCRRRRRRRRTHRRRLRLGR